MKKYLKKAGVFFTCLAMALTMLLSVNVSADWGVPPTDSDTGEIKVTNVKNETGVTVKAYKIVEGDYITGGGIRGYKWTSGVKTLSGFETKDAFVVTDGEKNLNLSAADMATLAAAARKGSLGDAIEMTSGSPDSNNKVTYTGSNLGVGTYLVLVEGSSATVYNPMLVSIYYTVDGKFKNEVSAEDSWQIGNSNSYAKSSEPEITKEIISDNRQAGTGEGKGDDAGIGDTMTFEVTATIPDYTSGQYTNPVVKVSDVLPAGLTYVPATMNVVIKGGSELSENTDYTLVTTTSGDNSGGGFTVTLNNNTIINNPQKTVLIHYSAKVNDKATYNFEANVNNAKLEYSNNPSDSNDVQTKEDRTYNYTFSIDAEIYGNTETEIDKEKTKSKTTHEIVKVDDTVIDKTETQTDTEYWKQIIEGDKKSALAGAEFSLYKAAVDGDGNFKKNNDKYLTDGDAIGKATSDDKGALSFYRLDAGKYILKETQAPKGYSLNEELIPVEITAVYNQDGTLNSYSVKIADKYTSTYSADYQPYSQGSGKQVVRSITTNTTTTTQTTYPFKNTKTPSLPSTGGMGTYIFTVIGVAVMLVAAGGFMVRRRKNC